MRVHTEIYRMPTFGNLFTFQKYHLNDPKQNKATNSLSEYIARICKRYFSHFLLLQVKTLRTL